MSAEKEYSKVYSKTTCPVVTYEYLRCTGFFYRTGERTHLITARHNVLPTNPNYLPYNPDWYLPKVDIFLRKEGADRWVKKRYNVEENVYFSKESLDVLSIVIDFDPTNYGYIVYTKEDILNPCGESNEVTSLGFDNSCFPSDYSDYVDRIGKPRRLSLSEPFGSDTEEPSPDGIGVAIDMDGEGDYKGMSGSPVLGEKGPVGIHLMNSPFMKDQYMQQPELEGAQRIVFVEADRLEDIMSPRYRIPEGQVQVPFAIHP